MSKLQSIVRKHHCLTTHQRFAIDALPLLETDAAKRLTPWLLRHYGGYLRGAIDPDERFRDFHNHVIHARDGYWGGAPRVAQQWYGRLYRHLRAERFGEAAHAAGVLSHYVTDVFQPLHTASTERETLIHRPLEWSIECSYDRILDAWQSQPLQTVVELSPRHGWLGSMMLESARFSEKYFDKLVRRYRFQQGVDQPEAGLDAQAIRMLAELFALAVTAWARVLDRVASQAESDGGVEFPECGMFWPTATARLTVPWKSWRSRIRFRVQSHAVQALANEYFRTGKLVENLPDEVDVKRRVIQVRLKEREHQATRKSA